MTSKVVYKLETFFTQKGKHLEKKIWNFYQNKIIKTYSYYLNQRLKQNKIISIQKFISK